MPHSVRDRGFLPLTDTVPARTSATASSVTTVSAPPMLSAPVAGERDPAVLVLADVAQSKMRRKIPDLVEALIGHFDPAAHR